MESMAKTVWDFLRFLTFRFLRDNAMGNAAALTYTTLLSLVPLMTVTLAIFSAFPISDKVSQEVQDFVFNNFVPTSGEVVQSYLQDFSQKASRLTGAGSVFLFVVALLLMSNIDRALNTIWQVKKKRRPMNVFMVYWAILSLGPILIGISVAITSYLVSMPLFTDAAETLGIRATLFRMLPLFASIVAFTLMYLVVPNRRVRVRHALAGGLLAAVLFELAKRGFAFYVAYFPTYEAIYGALAIVPIFLIWIYLSWLVTLLGAEFTHCLQVYREDWRRCYTGPEASLLSAYRILGDLWRAQQSGRTLSQHQLADLQPQTPEPLLEDQLYRLKAANLVLRTSEDQWALARDMHDVKMSDLYAAGRYRLPEEPILEDLRRTGEGALADVLSDTETGVRRSMDVPLAELYQHKPDADRD